MEGSTAVELSVGEIFQQRAQLYRISSGSFNLSGGLSGRSESFQLNGKLQITRLGDPGYDRICPGEQWQFA
jgi:hypothetical protein